MLSVPAQLAALFHGLFPGATAELLAAANRLLPGPVDGSSEAVPGRDAQSPISRSWLTALTQRAARENNEGV